MTQARDMLQCSTGGASRDGVEMDPGIRLEGHRAVIEEIGPALTAARQVATLAVEFPEV